MRVWRSSSRNTICLKYDLKITDYSEEVASRRRVGRSTLAGTSTTSKHIPDILKTGLLGARQATSRQHTLTNHSIASRSIINSSITNRSITRLNIRPRLHRHRFLNHHSVSIRVRRRPSMAIHLSSLHRTVTRRLIHRGGCLKEVESSLQPRSCSLSSECSVSHGASSSLSRASPCPLSVVSR